MKHLALSVVAWACAEATAAQAKPLLLLISIDGLKPEAVFQAEQHGLKLPNLRAFVADGVHAIGVRGVLPTLTYRKRSTKTALA